jgi:TolB protein
MNRILHSICAASISAALAIVAVSAGPQQPPAAPPASQPPPAAPQQPSEVGTVINSEGGAPTRLAVPDFIALSTDAETDRIAKTIAQVLYDDLNFEREFALIPRDTYATIPAARTFEDVPLDRWRELGADAVLVGTVQKTAAGVLVQVRLFDARRPEQRQQAFGKEYSGSAANPRSYAHVISDEIHDKQRALRGVARTKLTFASDRDGERMGGTVESRSVKEIYISDYDGANQRRVTTGRSLNIQPNWSPDAGSIAYTSYRNRDTTGRSLNIQPNWSPDAGSIAYTSYRNRDGLPNIFISHIYKGLLDQFPKAPEQTFQPSWSPDGTRIAFWSTRDGNAEIYVANRDGSNVRRLTNNRGIDQSPTWSPNGTQIAFVSDRTGTPQVWVMGTDGLGLRKITSESYADRPTWSPAPYNEIAYTARNGPGFDIKVIDLASGQIRQFTFGEGTNESPAWAPNGRHLAFTSTRSGKVQVFTIDRAGKNLKQVTNIGNNEKPDWSK